METSRYTTKRFVLEEPTGKEEVDAWATSLGWIRGPEIDGDPTAGVEHQIVWTARDVAAIHYAEDIYYSFPYYTLTGPLERIVDALAVQAEAELHPWTIEDLCETHDLTEGTDQKALSAYLLGIAGSSEYDERVFTRISAMLADPDERARDTAIHAITYADYPEFLPALTRMAEHDPDREIRVLAAAARDVLASKETEPR